MQWRHVGVLGFCVYDVWCAHLFTGMDFKEIRHIHAQIWILVSLHWCNMVGIWHVLYITIYSNRPHSRRNMCVMSSYQYLATSVAGNRPRKVIHKFCHDSLVREDGWEGMCGMYVTPSLAGPSPALCLEYTQHNLRVFSFLYNPNTKSNHWELNSPLDILLRAVNFLSSCEKDVE